MAAPMSPSSNPADDYGDREPDHGESQALQIGH
jgi:hypothetical protein